MEEMTNAPQAEEGVTLADLWHVFTKHIVAILAVVIVVTLATGIITKIFVKTEYKATATLIINAKNVYEEPQSVNISYDNAAITFGKNVAPTLVSTISDTDVVSNLVNEKASKESGIEKIKRSYLKVSYTEENLLISVSYTTVSSLKNAAATIKAVSDAICAMSNAIAKDENGNDRYEQVYKYVAIERNGKNYSEKVEVIEKDADGNEIKVTKPIYQYPFANSVFAVQTTAENKVVASNNWKLYTIIAAVLALVVAYLVFFILERLDDTVCSKKDIEESTGFNVIAYVVDPVAVEKRGKKNAR